MSRWYDSDAEVQSVTLTAQDEGFTVVKIEWSVKGSGVFQSSELMVHTAELNEETREKVRTAQAAVLLLCEVLAEGNVMKEDPDEGMGWQS